MYYCCAITDKGIRPHNEDALLVHKTVLTDGVTEWKLKQPFLVAVADGVSGELSGELASETCVKMLKDVSFSSKTDMLSVLMQIHTSLAQMGAKSKDTINMQTTLCAVGIDEHGNMHIANVGDSRLYRLRDDTLTQLSKDQTLVQMLFDNGTITHEEKRTHKHRNIIFPVLGNVSSVPQFDVHANYERIQPNDILLLCSDGLSDYVTDDEICQILRSPAPLVRRLQLLLELADVNGSQDNITLVALTSLHNQ